MTYRISELMEDFQEQMPWETEPAPLSMERIRQRTLAQVQMPSRKRMGGGKLMKLLAAAAVLSALTMTAGAAEQVWGLRDWFRTALNQQAKEDVEFAEQWGLDVQYRDYVGADQLALLEEHGRVVNQSVTDGDTTMTLVAYYGDEYVMNLYLRVEAPEGTVLPDDVWYCFEETPWVYGGYEGPVGIPEGYAVGEGYIPDLQPLPDEDPQDNRKDFCFQLNHYPTVQRVNGVPQTQWSFTDEVPKTFTAKGLFMKREEGDWERLLFGHFQFDITNAHEVKRLEVPVEGLNYGGHIEYEWSHPSGFSEEVNYDYTVEPISLTISPFTMVTQCRSTCTDPQMLMSVEAEIVMKDGTSVSIQRYIGGESKDGFCHDVEMFSTPVNVEEIDYIFIGRQGNSEVYKVYP